MSRVDTPQFFILKTFIQTLYITFPVHNISTVGDATMS